MARSRSCKPGRGRAVLHPADHPAGEVGAPLCLQAVLDRDADGRREGAGNRLCFKRFQGSEATGRQVAGNAVNAQRVLPVRGDRDFDHRIDLGGVIGREPVGEAVAHLARRQFDDAGMFVRKLQLAFGCHHAVAFDAADLAHADGGVDARDVDAGMGDHDGDALARIGRAADDLLFALVGCHLADAEPVGIGVLFGLQHLADGKFGEPGGGVHHLFHFEAEIGQDLGDLVHRGIGLQVVLEPGQGEFHRDSPLAFRSSRAGVSPIRRRGKGRAGGQIGSVGPQEAGPAAKRAVESRWTPHSGRVADTVRAPSRFR